MMVSHSVRELVLVVIVMIFASNGLRVSIDAAMQVLLQLTGLAKVIRSTLHCVCSGEQHQKPETSETGTPQVPAADCLPCWTRHGGMQPDTTLVPLSV